MSPFQVALMNSARTIPGISALCCLALTVAAGAEPTPQKVTYTEHVLPIFRAKCGSCHNANDREGDLVLDDYTSLRTGGGSGEVIEPGNLENSYLWSLVTHESSPEMPPEQPRLPDEELSVIRAWIEQGAVQDAGSPSTASTPKLSLAKVDVPTNRPAGPPPMPTSYLGPPLRFTARSNAVTALATNPWSPVLAVSGHQQIALYDTRTRLLLGVLPFPEGQPHILKFSRNGRLLLAGGGRGGASGRVVVFDVATGERRFEVGDEYDLVLAADISPDHAQIALGGPKRLVRVYGTATGELLYELKKHTDWVTAIEFSPDSVLLASGDRSNGLVVWEAFTGREWLVLNGHRGAITDVGWRADSNVLVSACEDGTVKQWEMNDGRELKSVGAHGGGVSSIDLARDDRMVTTGRDQTAKLWQPDGTAIRTFSGLSDLGLEVAFDDETETVFAGDWNGQITAWSAADSKVLGQLSSNPPSVADQLRLALEAQAAAQAQAVSAQTAVANLQKQHEAALAQRRQQADALAAEARALQEQVAELTRSQESAAASAQQTDEQLRQADELLAAARRILDNAQREQAAAAAAAEQRRTALAQTEQALTQKQKDAEARASEAAAAQSALTVTPQEQQALQQAHEAATAAAADQARFDAVVSQLQALAQPSAEGAPASSPTP
jgi:WD40 repeat protein